MSHRGDFYPTVATRAAASERHMGEEPRSRPPWAGVWELVPGSLVAQEFPHSCRSVSPRAEPINTSGSVKTLDASFRSGFLTTLARFWPPPTAAWRLGTQPAIRTDPTHSVGPGMQDGTVDEASPPAAARGDSSPPYRTRPHHAACRESGGRMMRVCSRDVGLAVRLRVAAGSQVRHHRPGARSAPHAAGDLLRSRPVRPPARRRAHGPRLRLRPVELAEPAGLHASRRRSRASLGPARSATGWPTTCGTRRSTNGGRGCPRGWPLRPAPHCASCREPRTSHVQSLMGAKDQMLWMVRRG